VHVLRADCQWKALPKERFDRPSAVHKRFLEWERNRLLRVVVGGGLAELRSARRFSRTGAFIIAPLTLLPCQT